jgi:hypothetical protein
MRRTAIALSTAIIAGALGFARGAFGGDDGSDDYEKEEARAARAGRAWRHDGIAAAPKVVAALLSGDVWMEDEARNVLLRWGPRAVPPLLDWLARDLGESRRKMVEGDVPQETLSQLLCSVGMPRSEDDDDFAQAPVADNPRARVHAKAVLRAALAPIQAALRRKKSPRARAASEAVINMAFRNKCANRQIVFEATGNAMVALLDVQTAGRKGEFLLGLSTFGPAARAAIPAALPLLDDQRFKEQAIELLGAIGPASAPAVPKLRSLLAGEQRASAALALGNIGPAARAALPEIISLLEQADRNGCDKNLPLRALALPVGLLGATGESEASHAVGALLESLRACPRNAEPIITALGSVGPRGRAAEPALLAVMRDGASPLELRLLASSSLRAIGAPLSTDDQALLSSLEAELRRRKTPRPIVGNQL